MPSGREQVIHDSVSLALSTLADQTAIVGNTKIDTALQNGLFIKKIKLAATIRGLPANLGPVKYGISQGLSAAEIAEAIVADPQAPNDIPAKEQATRKAFPLGTFTKTGDEVIEVKTDLREIRGFPFKHISEEQSLAIYAFNDTGAALTGTAIIKVDLLFLVRWDRD